MPHPEVSGLLQTACYWAVVPNSFDSYGEHKRASTFVELPVRWTDSKDEIGDSQADPISYDATAVVKQDVGIGSVLWLGTQAELEAAVGGSGNGIVPTSDIFVVIGFKRSPDIKNRKRMRTVMLKRSSNAMPAAG